MTDHKSGSTIITVDIGNTSISMFRVNDTVCQDLGRCASDSNKDALSDFFQQTFSKGKHSSNSADSILICSVVPELTSSVDLIMQNIYQQSPQVVGRDLQVPIKNRYTYPDQVGRDRLVAAYESFHLVNGAVLIVDFGTATTIDVVTDDGAYEGGVILPGIDLTLKTLASDTALLPQIELHSKPKNLIGKTTEESLQSGIYYGYGHMCRGMVEDIISQRGDGYMPNIILTGGYANLFVDFFHAFPVQVEAALIHKGLYRLYLLQQKKFS